MPYGKPSLGTTPSNAVFQETPAGAIDGLNTVFTLANVPVPLTSLELFLNRVLMMDITDYSIVGNTITYVAAPQVGDVHVAYYFF